MSYILALIIEFCLRRLYFLSLLLIADFPKSGGVEFLIGWVFTWFKLTLWLIFFFGFTLLRSMLAFMLVVLSFKALPRLFLPFVPGSILEIDFERLLREIDILFLWREGAGLRVLFSLSSSSFCFETVKDFKSIYSFSESTVPILWTNC